MSDWPNIGGKLVGPPKRHGGRKPAEVMPMDSPTQCWCAIFGCQTRPEFMLTVVQSGRKSLRRYSCRSHMTLFHRPFDGVHGIRIDTTNLNPVEARLATDG